MPETLDGTYQHTLQDIDKADRTLTHRLFSCVSVACRPLRVKELAELLAFDFKAGPFRLFRRGWRRENLVDAVRSTYSSLLAIVNIEDTPVVQFSHFSVREFLGNVHLVQDKDNISWHHVSMTPAHTLVAQVCLDILLHMGNISITKKSLGRFPLAEYAAEHWVDHARFGNVSQIVEDRMKRLFDPRKPHLAVCLWIYNPEIPRWRRPE